MSIKKKKVADALDKLFNSASQSPSRTQNKPSMEKQLPAASIQQAVPAIEETKTAIEKIPLIKKKSSSSGGKQTPKTTAASPVPPTPREAAQIEQTLVTSVSTTPIHTQPLQNEPEINRTDAPLDLSLEEAQLSSVTPSGQLDDQDSIQLVVFMLGEEYFGVYIAVVESIIKMQAITVVPRSKPYVLGVTNLRGTVLPVINLRKRFALAEDQSNENQRIVVILVNDEKIGLLVDNVSQVIRIPKNAIEPAPLLVSSVNTSFITGIAKHEDSLIIMLDLRKIFE